MFMGNERLNSNIFVTTVGESLVALLCSCHLVFLVTFGLVFFFFHSVKEWGGGGGGGYREGTLPFHVC